tara:strand:- start:225 stop:1049 length:825 start_codon:yes stop_codon:yes gene_type:complete
MRWISIIRKKKAVVSILKLNGVIASSSFRSNLSIATMSESIEQAFRQKNLKGVVLDINSPGGSPVQSSLIFNRIRAVALEKKVPVFSFVQDVAASGGYWLACAGDEIFVDNNSIIGSIGVISGGFGFQDFISRFGIERRLYTSGDQKSFLDPFKPEKEEDILRLKKLQSDIHESFKNLVRERRKGKLNADEIELFSGEFWTGSRALELGLVDGIGDIRTVMKDRFGEKVKFKDFGQGTSWLRRRLGLSLFQKSNVFEDFLHFLEARLMWSKFGL